MSEFEILAIRYAHNAASAFMLAPAKSPKASRSTSWGAVREDCSFCESERGEDGWCWRPMRRTTMLISSRNARFRSFFDVGETLNGYKTMKRLASSGSHIVPGHDPLVLRRYPTIEGGPADIVRLDAEPRE